MPESLQKLCARAAVPVLFLGSVVALVLLRGGDPDTATDAAGETWTCSMHPQVRRAGPGRCPICGMDLVPVSRLGDKAEAERRAGIETEAITRRELFKEVRTVGKLDYAESRIAHISARVGGRLDRLYADFTGITVKRGDHLADIYSPDLNITQRELLLALDAVERERPSLQPGQRSFSQSSLEAARNRLLLWGILPEQVQEFEKTRQIRNHVTIYAPIGGVIIEKAIREGQYVKEGDLLFRTADLDPLWLHLDVYEADLPWVRFGQTIAVTVEAYAGETYYGTVVFVDPALDDKTRTVKVRVNLKNPDLKLKPAMYATATIRVRLRGDGLPEPTGLEGKFLCPMHPEVVRDQSGRCPVCGMQLERVPPARRPTGAVSDALTKAGDAGKVLAVSTSAVLDTGRRRIAYRRAADGGFEPVELSLGPRAEGKDAAGRAAAYYAVLGGLQEGDQVVVRGGFLLDSQRQIEGLPGLLYPEGRSGGGLHSGHGGHSAAAAGRLDAPSQHKH